MRIENGPINFASIAAVLGLPAGLRYSLPVLLAASGAAVSHTGNTNETILATVSLPGNTMKAKSALRITTLWTVNNDADAKTGRIRLGGLSGAQIMALNMASTVTYQLQHIVRNRDVINSQVFQVVTAGSSFTNSSGSPGTASIDMSVAQDLVFTAQLASGADSITLESYMVELLLGIN